MRPAATEALPANGSRWRRWLVGILGVLVIAGAGLGAWQWIGGGAARPGPRVAEPAPRFNLLASTGRVITLDEYLGKQEVVLLFYMTAG